MKNSTAVINKPDDIECTLTFTYTLKGWKAIKEKLGKGSYSYSGTDMSRELLDLVLQLESTLYASPAEGESDES